MSLEEIFQSEVTGWRFTRKPAEAFSSAGFPISKG